ncbi:MAG: radical SAM family heme chaperone HemW [Alphaproteobacteria bacterium]|jgi:oxygen-independent coproporphyrinogen-3 oxidase|nr:radical SAM family heme chaperone HemW [Alphaproteobacteria bacterium]MDP6564178.1 radical SAM family heme chaperone HemW [Alphaproteobacteria bacterium]MDP6815694.1 radical SAM family heme chaperone HemW [Alphaproteobacteria bacterium]
MPASKPTDADDRGFAVYVHWPFCLSKCPYCDFNSHVRDRVDQAAWRLALLAQFDHFAGLLSPRRVDSIFFGGGTPSLMPADTVAAVIDRIAGHWPLERSAEITLEANPTSAEAARFRGYSGAGVNRLSLGVQALHDDDLRRLGRGHDVAEALAALEAAAAVFDRLSFDLIYARPGQTPAAWRAELARAIGLARGHLSLYQLTIERGTAFHGTVPPPDADLAAELYEVTQESCEVAGLPAYEISNHAAKGQESRHNLVYWRYGDYLGLGPGAHGRLMLDGQRRALANLRSPEAWLDAVRGGGDGLDGDVPLDIDDRAAEMLMLGLRLRRGLSTAAFAAEVGRPLEQWLDSDRLRRLSDGGLIEIGEGSLRATAAGRQVLDGVLAELLA